MFVLDRKVCRYTLCANPVSLISFADVLEYIFIVYVYPSLVHNLNNLIPYLCALFGIFEDETSTLLNQFFQM